MQRHFWPFHDKSIRNVNWKIQLENVTQLETYRQDYPISAEAPANTIIKLLSKRCGFKRGKRNTLIV